MKPKLGYARNLRHGTLAGLHGRGVRHIENFPIHGDIWLETSEISTYDGNFIDFVCDDTWYIVLTNIFQIVL